MGFGKDGKGVIIIESRPQAIGTLAHQTGLFIGTKLAILKDFRMLKSELTVVINSVTAGDLLGLALYLVDGDLSLAEAEAAIESNGPVGPNDSVAMAIAERFVKLVGLVDHNELNTEVQLEDAATGAPMITVKPQWTFTTTKSWNWMLYNKGAAPTTGASALLQAKSFGVWLR